MADEHHLIDAETLLPRIGDLSLRIVDCRFDLADPAAGRRQYVESHIAGAVFADLDHDLSVSPEPHTGRHPLPPVQSFARTLGQLGIGASTPVVVYDAGNGALAARAWWMLRWVGHQQVSLLDGGLERWRNLGYPMRAGVEDVQATDFVPSQRCMERLVL